MAANASIRAQRRAVLESPLRDFEAWLVAVDCGGPDCRRDRVYTLAELVGLYGGAVTIGAMLRRFRCQECGGKVTAATIQSGLQTGRHRPRALVLLPAP